MLGIQIIDLQETFNLLIDKLIIQYSPGYLKYCTIEGNSECHFLFLDLLNIFFNCRKNFGRRLYQNLVISSNINSEEKSVLNSRVVNS